MRIVLFPACVSNMCMLQLFYEKRTWLQSGTYIVKIPLFWYREMVKLEEGCMEALRQIEDKKYETHLVEDGMQVILKYGVACFRKYCKVEKWNEKR